MSPPESPDVLFGLGQSIRELHTWTVLIWLLGELLRGSEPWPCAISPHCGMLANKPVSPTAACPGGCDWGCGCYSLWGPGGNVSFRPCTRNSRASPEQPAWFVFFCGHSKLCNCLSFKATSDPLGIRYYKIKLFRVKTKAPYLTHYITFGKDTSLAFTFFACEENVINIYKALRVHSEQVIMETS